MKQPGNAVRTLCAAFIGTAAALWNDMAEAGPQFAAGSIIHFGGGTSIPLGHHEFCRASAIQAAECAVVTQDISPKVLTREAWQELVVVNEIINTNIRPFGDIDAYGVEEKWAYPTGNIGDCEDYVLEKRRWLIDTGHWNESQLLITVVRQSNGEGHAILTARTDQGDFILDNLVKDRVLPLAQVIKSESNPGGYTFIKIQNPEYSGRWRDVLNHYTDMNTSTTSQPKPAL